jgi:hypothetical protein
VTGKVAPDTVKPVPLIAAELIVTGAVPVEVNVTGSVDAMFTVTLPNARFAGLKVNVGVETLPPVPTPLIGTCATTPPAALVAVTWPE